MKKINFILSSLNDSHYRKRVEEFMDNGYNVKVYGFKRQGLDLPKFKYDVTVLGSISNQNYKERLKLYYDTFKAIAKECRGELCFYSSLDIALFGNLLIKSPYIYEVCDLTELVISNKIVSKLLTKLNKYFILKSKHTILTSEGFVSYFKDLPHNKYSLIPNKVSLPLDADFEIKRVFSQERIKIGFVGCIRFQTTYNFIKVCLEKYANIEIHLYGIFSEGDKFSDNVKALLGNYPNIYYHGSFKNPDDLFSIYSQIDMVLSAYTPSPGVIYAEPNKLYEAIYFRCPIIVSKNTFLGEKVSKLNLGYVIDAMTEDGICEFVDSLNEKVYNDILKSCLEYPRRDCVNENKEFFETIEYLC